MSTDYQPRKFAKGLTEFVLRSGHTELFDQNRILNEVARGNIELPTKFNNSPLPTSWIGVPLSYRQEVVGVLACQSFNNEYQYKQSDIDLISFVSEQVSNVIVKHLADNELEQRVEQKTAELQQANIHLQLQIEERKKIERQLFHDAHHDNLTGLANRSLFISQLEKTLERHKRDNTLGYAVMFIDLDNFKNINDNFGHHAGDQFLKSTANEFLACIREHDLLARFGGDEFVILLTHLQHEDEAKHIAKRIIKTISKPFCIGELCITSGASIGIAYSHKKYHNTDEIIGDADSAMYAAKKAGKSTIRCSEKSHTNHNNLLDKTSLENAALSFSTSKIINLTADNAIATYYKPLIAHSSGVNLELNSYLENQNQPINYCDYLLSQVIPNLPQNELVFLQLHASVLADEFTQFHDALKATSHNICWLINDANLSELSTTQLNNFQALKQLGYQIAISDVARNQIDLVKLTCIQFDYFLLDESFCRRLLNETMVQNQLSALLALTQNNKTRLIATGPTIVNYQASLKTLGLTLFLSQIKQDSKPVSKANSEHQTPQTSIKLT